MSHHIMPLVVHSLEGGHTHARPHTHTHTHTHTYTHTHAYRHSRTEAILRNRVCAGLRAPSFLVIQPSTKNCG